MPTYEEHAIGVSMGYAIGFWGVTFAESAVCICHLLTNIFFCLKLFTDIY